jgi:hypothetical protein
MSDMSRRTARANRIALTVIGLLLFAIGAAALVRGLGLYPRLFGEPHASIVDRPARTFAHRHLWFWVALAATMFVVAVAAVSWLAAQFHRRTARALRWETDAREGVTTLSARALADALHGDLSGHSYLRRPRVTLTGGPADPRLHLAVTVAPDADPAEARNGIHQALRRLRRAVDERLPTVVHIRTGR